MQTITDELATALRTLRDPKNKWGSTEAVDSFIDEALAKYETHRQEHPAHLSKEVQIANMTQHGAPVDVQDGGGL